MPTKCCAPDTPIRSCSSTLFCSPASKQLYSLVFSWAGAFSVLAILKYLALDVALPCPEPETRWNCILTQRTALFTSAGASFGLLVAMGMGLKYLCCGPTDGTGPRSVRNNSTAGIDTSSRLSPNTQPRLRQPASQASVPLSNEPADAILSKPDFDIEEGRDDTQVTISRT